MSIPINLDEASAEELQKILESVDYILSDCDGVIWTKKPFPLVGEFFRKLGERGKRISFVSNNSLRSRDDYIRLFNEADIPNGIDNLTYPSIAIAKYLKSLQYDKTVFCVASAETIKTLQSQGFKCKEGPLYGAEYYGDYMQYLVDDPAVGAVVFDSDFRVNMPKLYMASTYLDRPEVLFIAGATDRIVPLAKGVTSIGPGQFTDIVAEKVGRAPVVLAKPGLPYAQLIMSKYGITRPERVLFIGDMIAQDIAFGKAAGFQTLLVLTTHSVQDMMQNESLRPDYCATSLTQLVHKLK